MGEGGQEGRWFCFFLFFSFFSVLRSDLKGAGAIRLRMDGWKSRKGDYESGLGKKEEGK